MAGAQQIGANVFATAQQIARGFFLLRRNVNGRQGAGAIEHRQLAGVAPIRFDPIARSSGNQRRSDDVARNLMAGEGALQLEAAGARFVTTLHRALAAQPLDEPQDRGGVRRQRMQRGRPLSRQQDRRHRRGRVLIERDDGYRLQHDRPPLYAALR